MVLLTCAAVGVMLFLCYQVFLKLYFNLEAQVFEELLMEVYALDTDPVFSQRGDGDLRPIEPEIPMMKIYDSTTKKKSRVSHTMPQRTRSCLEMTITKKIALKKRYNEVY
ncbi:unnamed protein product [Acanthoscelides obtectus]|uniref:Uncharacterized protein n=1 Tax=Acanthoscelides obtectus TaxID=200917 RepID=A0A9P0KPZ9_ACAOB|nr:unnamed protein product [Acanthoscelides obtectus]CAK1661950.1 hypothetical protein AOBTE_LOCUS22894 [Acanthoscelides obtectus]